MQPWFYSHGYFGILSIQIKDRNTIIFKVGALKALFSISNPKKNFLYFSTLIYIIIMRIYHYFQAFPYKNQK